jgi:hypothetical protein
VERRVQADQDDEDAGPRRNDPPWASRTGSGDARQRALMSDSTLLFEQRLVNGCAISLFGDRYLL